MARRGSAATSAMVAARASAETNARHGNSADAEPKARDGSQITDAEIDAARKRDERLGKVLPRATSARYDRKARLIVVTFKNGAIFSFPPALVRGFSTASAEQLADIRISGNGSGLHWDTLDKDLTVTGLLNGVFGTRKAMAWLAGQIKSPAKTAAARANGAKGGRPRKSGHA